MQIKRSFLFMSGLLLIAGTVHGGNGDLIVNGQVGVGTTTPSSSAAVDVTSTTKGFLPPRMTTAQRNAIASPTKGLLIFNTTTNVLNTYDGSSWIAVGGGSGGGYTGTINIHTADSCSTTSIQVSNGLITGVTIVPDQNQSPCGA